MPGKPEECRAHARNCLRIAETASNSKVTRMFVDLAHSWTKLAVELEDAHTYMAAIGNGDAISNWESLILLKQEKLRRRSSRADMRMAATLLSRVPYGKSEWPIVDGFIVTFGIAVETANTGQMEKVRIWNAMPSRQMHGYAKIARLKCATRIALLPLSLFS
jgi:hypothetical protein